MFTNLRVSRSSNLVDIARIIQKINWIFYLGIFQLPGWPGFKNRPPARRFLKRASRAQVEIISQNHERDVDREKLSSACVKNNLMVWWFIGVMPVMPPNILGIVMLIHAPWSCYLGESVMFTSPPTTTWLLPSGTALKHGNEQSPIYSHGWFSKYTPKFKGILTFTCLFSSGFPSGS